MNLNNHNEDFTIEFLSSIVIFILTFIGIVLGILNGKSLYESQYIGNLATDWTTALVILPMMIISLVYIRKNNLLGLLFLPGLLFYLIYVYFFYSIIVPFNWNFLLYIIITPLCGFTVLCIIYKIDSNKV